MDKIIDAIEAIRTAMIIFGVAYFFIYVAFCVKFASIAEEKGYSGEGRKYGWICFFFGIIGFCMVAALPDLSLYERVMRLDKKLSADTANANGSASSLPPKMFCPHCGAMNDAKSSICKKCGQHMNG